MASKYVARFKQGARMWQTDDLQTDRPCVLRRNVTCGYRRNRYASFRLIIQTQQ